MVLVIMPVRVVTWNVGLRGLRGTIALFGSVAKMIHALRADILCLQVSLCRDHGAASVCSHPRGVQHTSHAGSEASTKRHQQRPDAGRWLHLLFFSAEAQRCVLWCCDVLFDTMHACES